MRMRTYLVTGGLGFLGSGLVKALLRAGHSVRVLDDFSRGSAERLGQFRDEVEIVAGSVCDAEVVARAVRGVDSVCHFAFVNGTENFYRQPVRVLEVGVRGMLNVLDACMRAGVGELVLASSSEVYQTPPQVPTDESVPLSVPDPHNPRYSYGGSKIICELMAINYGREHFQRVLIVRPHNVYGPDMGWDHVIPQLTTRLLRVMSEAEVEIALPIQGTGEQSRAFIYIDDFVRGLMAVIERGRHLEIYNVGTTEEITVREVAERFGRCLEVRVRVVPGPEAPGGAQRRCPDIRKLKRLGFRPAISFDEGLRRTVEWYRAHVPREAVPRRVEQTPMRE